MDAIKSYIEKLDQQLAKIPHIKEIEEKTKIKKIYLFGGLIFTLIIVIFNNLAKFMTEILGFVYPAYQSLRAVESTRPEDDIQWLTYWVVFAVISASDMFLSFVPAYYVLKSAAIIWLIHPETKGAELVFKKVIRPYLLQNQGDIDSGFAVQYINKKVKTNAVKAADNVKTNVSKTAQQAVKEAMLDTKKLTEVLKDFGDGKEKAKVV